MRDEVLYKELQVLYLEWLIDITKLEFHNDLLEILHNRRFDWLIPNDDNREADGVELREKFLDDSNYTELVHFGLNPSECSVLEMLIGLSIRIDYLLIDEDTGDRVDYWFGLLLSNLDLLKYDDSSRIGMNERRNINHAITIFMERCYERNGKGGLFPMKSGRKDQRKQEIWYQMSAYLKENGYLSD